ncbi:MAG: hypothetical protein WC162_01410 [Sphaerochaetaceae bacterium]
MKKIIITILVLIIAFSIFAESKDDSSNFLKDIGFTIGHNENYFDNNYEYGLNLLLGLDAGLTEKLELNLIGTFEIVPSFIKDFSLGLELNYSLLGERVFSNRNAGMGINSMVGFGLYCNNHNDKNIFMPTTLVLRLYPATVGAPASGKRERILPLGLAYNFMTNDISMFFSVAMYDHYFKGTWKTNYK